MLPWFVIVFFLPTIYSIGEPHYECGEHGRFEYCIDGNPGCVVGCHCHPGYYFDTESKICEPNAKLVHEYRQIYEPTETVTTRESQEETDAVPTTTEQLLVKEADELGDWLYNQFFKTIENQVINKTDKSEEKPTRRSGNKLPQLQLSRRSGRRRSRKKKSGLRKKLLRITEDDSLFNSDSGDYDDDDGDGDESNEDDDDYSDESASCDTSKEKSKKKQKKDNDNNSNHVKDDEKEHGHRKVVIFNKKPKPPLPSFIFLPNFETPFYPPIGLPPPPALPMYPMVPVPPMIPFPAPSTPANNNNTTPAADSTPPPMASPSNGGPPNDPERGQSKIAINPKMRKMRKPRIPLHHRRNKLQGSDVPWGDQLTGNPNGLPGEINDVDFKYLSQLIHKSGPNANFDMKNQPSRRKGDEISANEVTTTRHLQDEQQDYFSDLGQKIASLIRNADTNRDKPTDSITPNQPSNSVSANKYSVFQNQNTYSPHSYWERYVRSPLRQFRGYGDPPENYKNYVNLFNIESEVETVADSGKPLSLGELENALVLMNNAKVEFDNTIEDDNYDSKEDNRNTTSNRSWNVNLLAPNHFDNVQDIYKENVQRTTAEPHIVPVQKLLPKVIRNNTRTEEVYLDNFNNLRGFLMQNLKHIANNTRTNQNHNHTHHSNIDIIPSLTRVNSLTRRLDHVEPTDLHGTFGYPKQTHPGSSVTVHKIHLAPIMKPNHKQYRQYKSPSGPPNTFYRDVHDFFALKDEDSYLKERVITQLPPIEKTYLPATYYSQVKYFDFFDK